MPVILSAAALLPVCHVQTQPASIRPFASAATSRNQTLNTGRTVLTRCGAVQGKLNTYNYFDNVWQFEVTGATFKLLPKAQGSMASAPRITADRIKLICVDSKLCQSTDQ